MTDLRELYQEVIVDHNKNPRNFHKLTACSHQAQGYNPLCGDQIALYLDIKDNKIVDVGFQGAGCAISTASASLMTEIIKGKTLAEAQTLFVDFHSLVTGNEVPDKHTNIGKLTVLAGVKEYPARVKCATLAWHAFHAALQGKQDMISTE